MNIEKVRPTTITVNLQNLRKNVLTIKSIVKQRKIMAIIKANAYGHGLLEIAKIFETYNEINYFGVAYIEEALTLRKNSIKLPILVLGGVFKEQIEEFVLNDIDIPISSLDKLKQVEKVSKLLKKKANVHIKIDTGMNRIGVRYYNAENFIKTCINSKLINIKGIYSHFCCSDETSSEITQKQLSRFIDICKIFEQEGVTVPLRHIANSGAIIANNQDSFLDMVRPGIIMYGVSPTYNNFPSFKPVLSLTTKVSYFKVVKKGEIVSYNGIWKANKDTRVITIPIGYGDGYTQLLSNKANALIHGKKYPIIGKICMDQCMIEIGFDSVYNGEKVVLIGSQYSHNINVETLAQLANISTYEFLVSLNNRLPRLYI